MKKVLLISSIFAGLFLVGCSTNITNETTTFTAQIISALQNVSQVEEISNPNLTLPSNINEHQIQKFFGLDGLKFALVLRPSMNVPLLEIPKTFSPSFTGVLIATKGDNAWTPLLEIKENKPPEESSGNNPYYLWTSDNKLFLSVIDANGAGSGEGIMKVFIISNDSTWELNGCYYFSADITNKTATGKYDYFAFSSQLSSQEKQPTENCSGDVTLVAND